jgi:hypothetical protein
LFFFEDRRHRRIEPFQRQLRAVPIGDNPKGGAIAKGDASVPPVEQALGGDAAERACREERAAGLGDKKVDEFVVAHGGALENAA